MSYLRGACAHLVTSLKSIVKYHLYNWCHTWTQYSEISIYMPLARYSSAVLLWIIQSITFFDENNSEHNLRSAVLEANLIQVYADPVKEK